MRKTLFVGGMVIALIFQGAPAEAATITLKASTYLTVTFDSSIKYGGKDCTKIKFKYKGWDGLSYPAQFEGIYIYTKSGDDVTSLALQIGDTYDMNGGGDPVSGVKYLEICQSDQSQLVDPSCDEEAQNAIGETCEYEDVPGVKPGTYYIQASVTQIKPLVMKDSKKVKITIGK